MSEWEDLLLDIKPIKQKDFIAKPLKPIIIKSQEDEYVTMPSQASNGLDANTDKKFRKEQFRVEGTLDLHGYTYDTAFLAVTKFVKNAYHNQKRCIIIITGKGECLRDALPQWLQNSDLKNIILSQTTPSAKLGGSGAIMLLLKRNKK